MSNIPPPGNWANYPRPGLGPNAATLRLLADGYFGLNTVFILNVLLNIVTNSMARSKDPSLGLLIGLIAITFILVLVLTLPHNKKIGEGLGWSPSGHIVASSLMALNSAICCGIIGYVVVQSMAAKKFKEAGAPRGFFGYKKVELYAFIDQLGMQNPAPPTGPI